MVLTVQYKLLILVILIFIAQLRRPLYELYVPSRGWIWALPRGGAAVELRPAEAPETGLLSFLLFPLFLLLLLLPLLPFLPLLLFSIVTTITTITIIIITIIIIIIIIAITIIIIIIIIITIMFITAVFRGARLGLVHGKVGRRHAGWRGVLL